jgi:cytochrome c-type biogenesis protein CcmH
MIFFWFCIALLTVVALLILIYPFVFSSARFIPLNREKTNIAIYEENLKQLDKDYAQKNISQNQFEENKVALQKNLLEDIPEKSHETSRGGLQAQPNFVSDFPSPARGRVHWKTFLFLAITFPLFSILFYLYNGNSQLLAKTFLAKKEALEINQVKQALGSPQHVIDILRNHLAQEPNSAKGWYLLGRLYFTQQEYREAVKAFEKAYQLNKNNPDIVFQYAQALYLTQHTLNGKPTVLLEQLLVLQPKNPLAINLLAVAAFNDKHYRQAIHYWEKLLPYYSPETADGKALLDAIARANQKITHQM